MNLILQRGLESQSCKELVSGMFEKNTLLFSEKNGKCFQILKKRIM